VEFKTYEDVIQFAIEREEEAVRAYGDMSEKANQPGLKQLLIELREEEKRHKQLLQDMSPERIARLKLKPVTDLKISDYLVEEALDEEMTFQELLIFAAQKEQRSVNLYTELAGRTEDDDLKKMFLFMAEQEQGHKLKLEKEYDEHVLWED
jgi:rubrerythrin